MKIKINKNHRGDAKGAKPSRFLIELKNEIQDLGEKEAEKENLERKNTYLVFAYKTFFWIKKKVKPQTNVYYLNEKQKKNIKGLVFYPFFKIVYKFSKVFIWFIHFSLRFFYFSTHLIVSNFKLHSCAIKKTHKNSKKNILDWKQSAHIPGDKILGTVLEKKNKKNFSFKAFFTLSFLKKIRPVFTIHGFKKILYFSIILIIFALPFKFFDLYNNSDLSDIKGRVLGSSEDAVSDLILASKSASDYDFISAQGNFARAKDDLLGVKIELEKINNGLFFLASLVPNQKIKLASEGKKIIQAGILGSEIGDNFSSAISGFSSKNTLMNSLEQFNLNIGLARKNILELSELLDGIDVGALPLEFSDKIALVKSSLSQSDPVLLEIFDLSEKLMTFLGQKHDKRYLFIFQNNSELRATGGFIGSYALVDVSNGVIKNMEIPGGGSYDTEAGLRDFIVAPEPLQLVNPLWHFWDANWWPDFKKSAQKLMWFYEHSDGPSVDGVISITPNVIEELLGVIGPIDMTKDYGIVVNKDNFWIETQSLAEQKPNKTKKPKKIIGDLMNKIFEEFPKRINKDNILDFSKVLLKTLNEKQILFYFEDEGLQKKAREYSWSGEIEDTMADYLMVVNTNIAGGKSDRVIEQKINHKVEISKNGDIYDTVVVERKHTGLKGDLFTGVRNNSWMRFYVPLGSELIEAHGFWPIDEKLFSKPEDSWEIDPDLIAEREAHVDTDSWTKIYDDSGKTVFANWSWVNPGETVVVSLKYKLPFNINFEKDEKASNLYQKIQEFISGKNNKLASYSLMIQKQSGTNNDTISSSLSISGQSKIVWSYGIGGGLNNNGWNMKGILNIDKYFAILLEE